MGEEQLEINFIFIVIFGIVLMVIILLIVLFITFNNRKNKLIQEQLQTALDHQQKTHTLELEALRAQMNPHFVHNSLNAIQYYIQRNEVEISENYLAKFSKLMRQFFDFSRRQTIFLADEIDLLKNYLYIEKLRFEEKLEYQINIDPNLDTEEEQIPAMILQPIVENAVNHGLFHKKGKGLVSISFNQLTKTKYQVTITDDGIGINKAIQMKNGKTDKYAHSSSVITERLKLLKESNKWDIQYHIKDRLKSEGTSGTTVNLEFEMK